MKRLRNLAYMYLKESLVNLLTLRGGGISADQWLWRLPWDQAVLTTTSSSDGAVERALVSHQSGPGSIPRLGVICGLSLLVLYSGFPSPQKPTFDLICVNFNLQCPQLVLQR